MLSRISGNGHVAPKGICLCLIGAATKNAKIQIQIRVWEIQAAITKIGDWMGRFRNVLTKTISSNQTPLSVIFVALPHFNFKFMILFSSIFPLVIFTFSNLTITFSNHVRNHFKLPMPLHHIQ